MPRAEKIIIPGQVPVRHTSAHSQRVCNAFPFFTRDLPACRAVQWGNTKQNCVVNEISELVNLMVYLLDGKNIPCLISIQEVLGRVVNRKFYSYCKLISKMTFIQN